MKLLSNLIEDFLLIKMKNTFLLMAVIGAILSFINSFSGLLDDNYGKASFYLACFVINISSFFIFKENE